MKGILIIDKEQGKTSHDVVNDLRKILQMKRIGHTGTLDPLATGVLPMCIGRGTRLAEYIQNDKKEYIATADIGYRTDTLDVTGEITSESNKKTFDREELEQVIQNYIGDIQQYPPMYSAIRINGKRLYEYAREGKTIERKPRNVTIYSLDILNTTPSSFTIKVLCSTGTYIRTLVDDIGQDLESYATMTSLIRTQVGEFTLSNAYKVSDLRDKSKDEIERKILPLESAVSHFPNYIVEDRLYNSLTNGQPLKVNLGQVAENQLYRIYCKDQFIGVGYFIIQKDHAILRMKKVLI